MTDFRPLDLELIKARLNPPEHELLVGCPMYSGWVERDAIAKLLGEVEHWRQLALSPSGADLVDARIAGHGDGQVHAIEDVLRLKHWYDNAERGLVIRVEDIKALLPPAPLQTP